MNERTIQVRFKLKLQAFRIDGEIDNVSVDTWYGAGENTDPDARIIAFDLDVPLSLWEPPVVKGKIKTQLEGILNEFVEGMETYAD